MSKKKKVDYRAWANKHFRDPGKHLPIVIPVGGIGEGKKPIICSVCGKEVHRGTYKEDCKWYCDICK
jgi:hypothetical protein